MVFSAACCNIYIFKFNLTVIIMIVSRVSISNHWPDELDTTDSDMCCHVLDNCKNYVIYSSLYLLYTIYLCYTAGEACTVLKHILLSLYVHFGESFAFIKTSIYLKHCVKHNVISVQCLLVGEGLTMLFPNLPILHYLCDCEIYLMATNTVASKQ